jgi:hypothetical protein
VSLDIDNEPSLIWTGPAVAPLAVAAVFCLYGARAMIDHPGLAPLRVRTDASEAVGMSCHIRATRGGTRRPFTALRNQAGRDVAGSPQLNLPGAVATTTNASTVAPGASGSRE